jgi:hypothetical protein
MRITNRTRLINRRRGCRVTAQLAAAVMAFGALREGRAQEPRSPNNYAELLEPCIAEILNTDKIPGLAVGIVENDELVYARGFGLMKLGDPARPVTTRTLFHMASITKPFVATAIMQLAEQGKVDLDAPVKRPRAQRCFPRSSGSDGRAGIREPARSESCFDRRRLLLQSGHFARGRIGLPTCPGEHRSKLRATCRSGSRSYSICHS